MSSATPFPAEANAHALAGAPAGESFWADRAASAPERPQSPPQPPRQGSAETGAGPREDAAGPTLPGSSPRSQWDQLSGHLGDRRGSFAPGDWIGAARTALIPIGVMFLLSVLVAWNTGRTSLPFGQLIPVGAMLTGLAVGGGLSIRGGVATTTVSGSVSVMPLTLTLIGCALLGVLFYRWQRARPERAFAELALDIARTWVVWLGGLLVVCLIGRSSLGVAGGPVVSAGIGSTLLNGTLWLVITAVVVLAWKLPESLPARVRAWRDAVSAPVLGVLTAVAVSALGSIVTLIVLAVMASDAYPPLNHTSVPLFLMVAPSVLLMMFAFALGVPLSMSGQATYLLSGLSGNAAATNSFGLIDATDLDVQWWLLALFNVIALLIGGVVAALRAPSPQQARRTGWRMGIVLAVALTATAVCTGVFSNGGVTLRAAGELSLGLDGMLALLLGLGWGALLGWVSALLAPRLPHAVISAVRRRL